MAFGPLAGVAIYELGGYASSFGTFAILFLLFTILIKVFVSNKVDHDNEEKFDTSQYSYFHILTNRRILFANLSLIINIAQYTFIDPILSTRMKKDFGYTERATSLLFFVMGLGYASS